MTELEDGKIPNFFIIGAPKCGTTSLSVYLREHNNVFIPRLKEPHFFCTDFHVGRNVESFEKYKRLFSAVSQDHIAVGEASVWYMYSKVAIRNICDYNPCSRIIAMLRNPIELVQSLHAQQLYSFQEDRQDFRVAWSLQEERRLGKKIPRTCYVPDMIQYVKIGMLGEQVEGVLEIFPSDQVKLILFDDFKADTRRVYQDVLSFLGVPDDNRHCFPVINERKAHRSTWLARILQDSHNRPAMWLRYMDLLLSKTPGLKYLHLKDRLLDLNLSTRRPPSLHPLFWQELADAFRDDIDRLSTILDRDLDHWLVREQADEPG